ncbi:MAG: hypothetical protein MZV63_45520 [Marinilabiliales bacterium]|nr:hypothetical protein [Marinilabiliales bacterium]
MPWEHSSFLLPVSRYFHIPIELLLIFMRNSGITTGDKSSSYTEVQTHACSSCGVCISVCQMSYAAGINDMQSAYFIKGLQERQGHSRHHRQLPHVRQV